jgi:hypothetical protein
LSSHLKYTEGNTNNDLPALKQESDFVNTTLADLLIKLGDGCKVTEKEIAHAINTTRTFIELNEQLRQRHRSEDTPDTTNEENPQLIRTMTSVLKYPGILDVYESTLMREEAGARRFMGGKEILIDAVGSWNSFKQKYLLELNKE